jgi:hypothetical protein
MSGMSSDARAKRGLLFLDRFADQTEARLGQAFRLHRAFDPGFHLDAVAPEIVAIATSGGKGASTALVTALYRNRCCRSRFCAAPEHSRHNHTRLADR